MRVLVIGGTRNLGHDLVRELLRHDHAVTVLNRGLTPGMLPPEVTRLRADRRDARAVQRAIHGHDFDAVVDTTLYTGPEATDAVATFAGRVARYVFISTGQVYLVRDPEPPFPAREEDAAGPTAPEPPVGDPAHGEWMYGMDKRAAEQVFDHASYTGRLATTTLRLPMVNSERDPYHRIANYLARLEDGGPILVPAGESRPLCHVYGADVARVIAEMLDAGLGVSETYNLAQNETISLTGFLALLAGLLNRPLTLAPIARDALEAHGLLPAASPFGVRYMSVLSNARSTRELGAVYTPLAEYLSRIVQHHRAVGSVPSGYGQRAREIALAASLANAR